jgi:hypothetical protein
MNLTCKIIFNVNIVSFLIIYVAINFSGNHFGIMKEITQKRGLIMDF